MTDLPPAREALTRVEAIAPAVDPISFLPFKRFKLAHPGRCEKTQRARRTKARHKAERIIAADPATPLLAECARVLGALADAADTVGIEHFDTDDFSDEVQAMQNATLKARDLLTRLHAAIGEG